MKLLDFMHECPPGHNQLLDSSTGTAHESRLQVHCSRDCRGGLGRMLRGVTVTMPVHSVRNGKKVNMHTFKPHASNIGRVVKYYATSPRPEVRAARSRRVPLAAY